MTDQANSSKRVTNPSLYETHFPGDLKWDTSLKGTPVADMLDNTVEKYGDNAGFHFLGNEWTWKELQQSSLYLAKALQDRGIGKGSKVGLCLPNTPYYLIAYYAIARTGATIVNFNPLYADEEIKFQIQDSECEIMFTVDLKAVHEKVERRLDDTDLKSIIVCRFTDLLPFPKNFLFNILKAGDKADIADDRRIEWYHDLVNHRKDPVPVEIRPEEDVVLLQYTGGTTGTPKGAMLTHANITVNVEQATLWFAGSNEGEDKMVGVIPFFHVFAMTAVLNLSVRNAFKIIATPRFDLKDTLDIIQKHKAQFLVAVPAIYTAINNYSKLDKYDLSSLDYCVSGGAPLPAEVKRKFQDKTGCYMVEGYGLSEASPVVTINPPGGKNPNGSIGLPMPGTYIKIVDKDDRKTELGLDQPGELCLKGPQVMRGYYNKPDETADTIRDGWLHTGDVARVDEDGFVYIVDRIKDLIITNGYNVYPRHVEEAIYEHDAIEECIVAGIPDEKRGEVVKAWIKLKEGKSLTENELSEFLEDKLSKIEQPREIEFRKDPLPKTMIGKLSRKDILKEEQEKTSS